MKILNFSGENAAQRYEVLYDGLVHSTRGFEAPSETRIVSHILDKMETIGKPAERGGIRTFTLNGGGEVRLEDVEYQLLGEALKGARWTARAARMVTDTLDFFNGAT